jgi:FkbM family methyltransferase
VISLRQPGYLHRLARQLQLGPQSTANLFGAYYFSRRGWVKKLFPSTVVLDSPAWGKIPLRTNGEDIGLLSQIFVRRDYRMEASGVRRILDLGANIGMATIYLSRLFPEAQFACVEPSPENTPLLKRAIALNGIPARVFEAAAGAESGTTNLYLADKPVANSVYPVEGFSSLVTVPLISVPEIMNQMGWDRIDLLKIDIEGSEKEVLGRNNSWLSKVGLITGESHLDPEYRYDKLRADLGAFGFVLETLIPEGPDFGASFRGGRLGQ